MVSRLAGDDEVERAVGRRAAGEVERVHGDGVGVGRLVVVATPGAAPVTDAVRAHLLTSASKSTL